jgi:hypothetical protein
MNTRLVSPGAWVTKRGLSRPEATSSVVSGVCAAAAEASRRRPAVVRDVKRNMAI